MVQQFKRVFIPVSVTNIQSTGLEVFLKVWCSVVCVVCVFSLFPVDPVWYIQSAGSCLSTLEDSKVKRDLGVTSKYMKSLAKAGSF